MPRAGRWGAVEGYRGAECVVARTDAIAGQARSHPTRSHKPCISSVVADGVGAGLPRDEGATV